MGVLFVFILFILIIVVVAKRAKKKSDVAEMTPDLPETPEHMVNKTPTPEPDPDSITVYMNAERFGDWVCRNCECENPGSNTRCCVCNHQR